MWKPGPVFPGTSNGCDVMHARECLFNKQFLILTSSPFNDIFLIYLFVCAKSCILLHHFHFQYSTIYWRKEKRKDTFVFVLRKWWTASKSKRVRESGERERGIWGKKRCFFLGWTWKTLRHTDDEHKCDQKPDFTYRIQPLKDTWRPSMVTNWDKPVVTMEWWWQIQRQQIFSETQIKYLHNKAK